MIATLESVHGRALRDFVADGRRRALDYIIQRHWSSVTDLPPHKAIAAGRTTGKVLAYVNHGRWCVNCPVDGCAGAQLASETDLRFVCVVCAAGPHTVVWPKNRDAIEAALGVRPAPNRNWRPGEPVAQLAAENTERGV